MNALRHGQQRRHAARDEVLADAEPDHERAARSRATTMRSGSCASNTSSAYAPTKRCTARRTASSRSLALLQVLVDEMRDDLGVGLGLELVALRDQLVA